MASKPKQQETKGRETVSAKKEYLIQGTSEGLVTDCLTCYGEESLNEKLNGGWASWFEELAVYDVTNPSAPEFIERKTA
jgi:hypothetical protein|tara:strand:- start:443 stop:679 length:237 start_codon:yes stop_codon:yes gene_type:complete